MQHLIDFTYEGIDYTADVVVGYFHHHPPDSSADNDWDYYGWTDLDYHVSKLYWESEDGYALSEPMICDAYDAVYQRWNNDLQRGEVYAIIYEKLLDILLNECDNDVE